MRLREYQQETVEWLIERPRAVLAVEMGLGKTAITLSSLAPDQLPALVVAPPLVASRTWPEEAALWRPDLRVVEVKGGPVRREEALKRDGDIYVISMTVIGSTPGLSIRPGKRFRTLILDESSCYKNPTSVRTKAALALASSIERVRLLTGTLMSSSLEDAYPQMKMVDGGRRLGRTLTAFRQAWMTQGAVVGRTPGGVLIHRWDPRPGAAKEIHDRSADVTKVLRASTLGQTIPSSTMYHDYALSKRQWAVYAELQKKFVSEIRDGASVEAPSAALLSLRLRQVLSGDVPLDDGSTAHVSDARVDLAVDLAYQAIGYGPGPREPGNGVIVWYTFQSERDAVLKAMSGQAVSVKQPGALDTWMSGTTPVLVAHPLSAGHGLNLQHGGHHDVWIGQPWSLEEWDQACARLARSGQERTVVHHVIRASGPNGQRTVDHAVAQSLERKRGLSEALLGLVA